MGKIYSTLCGFLLVVSLTTASCKKVVEIDLKNAEPVLVIQGNIINGTHRQEVIISHTVSVSDTSIFNPVDGAVVTISTGNGQTYLLREWTEGNYATNKLTGIPGETYTLKVKIGNKEYEASSTMPYPVDLDSIKASLITFGTKKYHSVSVYYEDPVDETNYYRFKLYANSAESKNIFIYNDRFTNGGEVSRDLTDFDLEINSGDRITVNMECIDKNIYRYWQGINRNREEIFVTPANPVSNLSNGALGYFSAHTWLRHTIKFP